MGDVEVGKLPVVQINEADKPPVENSSDLQPRRNIVMSARGGQYNIGLKKPKTLFQWLRSFFVTEYSIPEEELEEYRMLSGLEPGEICRLNAYFEEAVGGKGNTMTRDMFLSVPFVASNPLKERLSLCFGYDEATGVTEMDFVTWLQGVALFNSHGRREEKLKLAFRMQDFDGDNQISKQDLSEYLQIVTENKLKEVLIKDLVDKCFAESCSDPKLQFISYQDFARVMAPTDFHIKLVLPF
jgi:serine/threonine-protein phosphatase 2B regulatory subunit